MKILPALHEAGMPGRSVSRRDILKGAAGTAALIGCPVLSRTALGAEIETLIETPDNLFCVYVDRASGKVVSSKSFIDVNPEIKEGKKAPVPYIAPTMNVSITHAPTVFKLDVARFGIVDMPKRNAELGAFNSLYDSYTPGEYTHHFLLNLADRELDRELGDWAYGNASEGQKKAALELLRRIHTGYNGELITNDAKKMADAVRFYTGREVLRPLLYLGKPPEAGVLALIPGKEIRLAARGTIQLALADSGAVAGSVSVGTNTGMSQGMSAAAEGATQGVSAVGAAVGASAGVGASSGGASSAGSGGDGGAGGGAAGAGAGAGNGGGGAGDGGAGAFLEQMKGTEVVSISYDIDGNRM
ncbi:MAG: hypothetical protein OEL53_00565 [Rhodospirillales bacterium]|nr:hypothetical protein [Rhodospirillales bacterium]